jgi:transformation/transcription domain-associated protein
MQHFITPNGLEGPFTASLIAIGRALSEPSNELHDYLAIFCKDELVSWYQTHRRSTIPDENLKDYVNSNVDLIIKKTQLISCKTERDEGYAERVCPLNQSILDLMSDAMNPSKLAMTDIAFLPQL